MTLGYPPKNTSLPVAVLKGIWYNVREGKARNQERGSSEICISFPALPLS